MLFPLIGVGAQVSVQFGIVESLKKMMKAKYADKDGVLAPKYSFIAGLISGVPSAIVVVNLVSFRLLSITQDLESLSIKRREKAQ